MQSNGVYGAVVAQRSTRRVLGGNHRLLAARALGALTLPVVWADVDDRTARRILLADNRVAGRWQQATGPTAVREPAAVTPSWLARPLAHMPEPDASPDKSPSPRLPRKPKMGRPLIKINRREFELKCEAQSTLENIAGYFHVHPRTLERWCHRTYRRTFADVFSEFRQPSRMALRQTMLLLALGGWKDRNDPDAKPLPPSVRMCIWLSKQKEWLNMADRYIETAASGEEIQHDFVLRFTKPVRVRRSTLDEDD